jgi:DNA-binding MarR family transcriptional regulator
MSLKTTPETTACNFLALKQATRSVSGLYERHIAKCGLTSPQFSIMRAIKANAGIDMHDLAEAMVMDRTSLLRALKPLARDGYVLQQASDAHPRKQVMSLTEAGLAKYAEAMEHWKAAQAEFEAEVGVDYARELRETLMGLTNKRL